MKSFVITPRDKSELRLINEFIESLGLPVSSFSQEEMEDFGLSKLMKSVDRKKTVTKASILKKLRK